MVDFQLVVMQFSIFSLICLAAHTIGKYLSLAKLPLISGFLFTGIIAGPYLLNIISKGSINNIKFIDQFALAFIAFAAGGELYLKELNQRFKSIKWITLSLVFSTFLLGVVGLLTLSEYIPFMKTLSFQARLAISLLGGSILVARSPSSAIAIIKEMRARGTFTQTALGVTVVMDVAVIILFSVNSSIADAIFTSIPFSFGFIFLLCIELFLSLIAGLLLGKVLQFLINLKFNFNVKALFIFFIGFSVFILSEKISHLTHTYFSYELLLEPLLVCMIAGFYVSNFTDVREEFLKILHIIAPPVYVAFFTLTGASIELKILVEVWHIALILFFVRLLGIFVGSFFGGVIAGDRMRVNRISWMAYITQAGVGLGLAKEVSDKFPEWGPSFASIFIAVIIMNQFVGPIFFKWVITLVRESHLPKEFGQFKGEQSAVIFGQGGKALALKAQLMSHDWSVKTVFYNSDKNKITEVSKEYDVVINDFEFETLKVIGVKSGITLVMMLSDEDSYSVCDTAYEHFSNSNFVVYLNQRDASGKFSALGAHVVLPSTAIICLLDQFVRTPSASTLLLGQEPNKDIIDVIVSNPISFGIKVRNLILPAGVVIVSISRANKVLVDLELIKIKSGDKVTVLGPIGGLDEVKLYLSV